MPITVVHTTAGNAASVTIPATTAGNCLIVCIASFNTTAQASVSGITLGGVADNFADTTATGHGTTGISFADSFIWADPNCAGGQTAIVISGSNLGLGSGTGGVIIYEVSGLATSSVVDKVSSSGAASGTSWTSNATAATTVAAEFWAGVASANSPTGPGAPWTNTTAGTRAIAGQQITSSTGTATYSGTQTSAVWAASVATFKSPAAVQGTVTRQQSKGRPAAAPGRAGTVRARPAVPVVSRARGRGQASARPGLARTVAARPVLAVPSRLLVRAVTGFARPGRIIVIRSTGAGTVPPPPIPIMADDGDAPWHIRSRRRRT